MAFLRKYGTGTGADVYIPMVKRGVVDFAVSADWTPASGDVKVSKDGGAAANIGTLPTAVTMGNTAMWKFVFTDAELQCAYLSVTVADSATKAVEDQMFAIETYGHASAMYKPDFSDSVRLGLTALPNAAADAAGGLPISDAGGLDLDTKLANTNEVTAARMGALTDWIDGGRLDLILDARASQTSVDDVPTVAEFEARTLVAASYSTVTTAQVNAQVLDVLNVDTLVAGKTIADALAIIGASAGGVISGAGTGTEVFKDFAGTTKLTVTVDSSGNRTLTVYA